MTDELKELLEDLAEYMDSKADADHDGENYQPNEEMKFKERIDKVEADAAPESDAVDFAEWISKENYRKVNSVGVLWGKGHENTNYTSEQLYELFKNKQ